MDHGRKDGATTSFDGSATPVSSTDKSRLLWLKPAQTWFVARSKIRYPVPNPGNWLAVFALITKKLCYRKDDRAMPPCDLYMDALKFSGLPDYAHRYYSQHFSWAFVPIDPMNVRTKFEVCSFTRSWDNRGYPKYLGSPWIHPRSIFSKIFNGLLFGLAL